jgi:hypothetical protein
VNLTQWSSASWGVQALTLTSLTAREESGVGLESS